MQSRDSSKSVGDDGERTHCWKTGEPARKGPSCSSVGSLLRVMLCTFIDDLDMVPESMVHTALDNTIDIFNVDDSKRGISDYLGISGTPYGKTIVVDSGAMRTCIIDFSLFVSISNRSPNLYIRVANGHRVRVRAIGTIKLDLRDTTGRLRSILVPNCLYVPELSHNLLSTKQLWKYNKIKCSLKGKTSCLKTQDGSKFQFHDAAGHYGLRAYSVSPDGTVENDRVPSHIIHSRLAHAGQERIRLAFYKSVGLPDLELYKKQPCDACLRGGAKRKPFPRGASNPYTKFGEKVFSDLCGPLPRSPGFNYKYALCFVDAATDWAAVYFCKSKSSDEVLEHFKQYQKDYREQLRWNDGHVKTWATDNGGEFTADQIQDFCTEMYIKRRYSVPYAPPQNAKAEGLWRILLRPVRTMLAESGQSLAFWPYAMEQACRIHNSLPNNRLDGAMSSYEAISGKSPNLASLRVWGCKAYYLLPPPDVKSKLAPRAAEAVHLGNDPRRKGYIIYVPSLNRITSAYHLEFRESEFLGPDHTFKGVEDDEAIDAEYEYGQVGRKFDPPHALPNADDDDTSVVDGRSEVGEDDDDFWAENRCSDTQCKFHKHPEGTPHSYQPRVSTGRPSESIRLFPRAGRGQRAGNASYINFCDRDSSGLFAHSLLLDDGNNDLHDGEEYVGDQDSLRQLVGVFETSTGAIEAPRTYEEAMASMDSESWRLSMDVEMRDLLAHKTWDLVPRSDLPKGRKPARSRWVYAIKFRRDGTLDRRKSRFVVCGYSQRPGLDYERVFSSTMRATSFRILCAMAVQLGLQLEHIDITSAFTQAGIEEDIWVEPARGYETYDKHGNVMLLKLRKSLYGTKQASRNWQIHLSAKLESLGFKRSTADPCLYTFDKDGKRMWIGVYVDDIIVAHSDNKLFQGFCTQLLDTKGGLRGKHVGKLSWFLGMAITQEKGSIAIDQSKYIGDLVEKFLPSQSTINIERDIPITEALFKKLGPAQDDAERQRVKKLPYLQLVGSLLYVSTHTRSDVSFAMSVLCQYMSDPSEADYEAALQVLLYLHKTKNLALQFRKEIRVPGELADVREFIENNHGFCAYSDSSWGMKNPAYGYIIYMSGGPISFVSKKLAGAASSSCEAEYDAASITAREMTFIRNVCEDMGFLLNGKLVLAVDNTAAIDVAHNMGASARTKHYEREMHYIREQVALGRTRMVHVATTHQRADFLTKLLDSSKFLAGRNFALS